MNLAAPYIWIMTSGIYDVLQIWDQEGTISYFDIYVNGTKVYTLEKDDDISYVTIEDLKLEENCDPSHGYNIGVIGYDSNENTTETSNLVCWYSDGEYDNNGADPDIDSPFKETTNFSFYLDDQLVESMSISYAFLTTSSLGSSGTLSAYLSPTSSKSVIIELTNSTTGVKYGYGYTYDTPLSAVSITPDSVTSSASTYTISVYATSGDIRYSFKRMCDNTSTIAGTSAQFHHYGKTAPTDCIAFLSDTEDFTLLARNVEWDGTLEYSTDRNNWVVWDGSEISSVGQAIYLRGHDNTKFYTSSGTQLYLSKPAGCYGNINTLLDYQAPPMEITTQNCYNGMFKYCTSLTQAPELPATTLSDNCYRNMFRNCINLTQAPELPATTLGNYCYFYMFCDCTSLTQAPELPATTLGNYCYGYMFRNCISLTQAPELPATTLGNYCYYYMFDNCTNLTQAPELPATTLSDYCYYYMFDNCTNLTQAPELPATTLTRNCYSYMFQGCISLTQAPELPATTLGNFCYCYMFANCTSLTQAPELPATTLTENCYWHMFKNCTSLTQAPELPATSLANRCYYYMFYNCTNLTQAPELPATTLSDYCYQSMFSGCTGLTQAPELPATTLSSCCYQSMFSGCTGLTQAPELPATTLSSECYYYMFRYCASIKLSNTQTGEYTQKYRIPTTGTGSTATNALKYMFASTGGTFTGTPSINTTYYLHSSNTIV